MNKIISSAPLILALAAGCSENVSNSDSPGTEPSNSGAGGGPPPSSGGMTSGTSGGAGQGNAQGGQLSTSVGGMSAGAGGAGAAQGGAAQGGATQGGATQGGAAQGGATQGGATQGGATQGGATQGGATQGGATQGGATQGGATQGGATQGGATQGGALPPVEGQLVSPPGAPIPVAEGSVEICKTGDSWVTLLSKNNIGCVKACQSRGMNCRRSYHDAAGACAPQPYELGCGHLVEQGTDFCACSSETFFQGKLHSEHPRTRVSPPLETCQAGEGWATIVFHDRSGCNAACQSVGLKCHAAYEDLELECGPQADPAFKLDCNNTLGHASDFCVCTVDGTAAGLPSSVVTPWRPF